MIAGRCPSSLLLCLAALVEVALPPSIGWSADEAGNGVAEDHTVRWVWYTQPALIPGLMPLAHSPVGPVPTGCGSCAGRGCVPKVGSFGYFEPMWRVWPCGPRPYPAAPPSLGPEPIPTPEGIAAPRAEQPEEPSLLPPQGPVPPMPSKPPVAADPTQASPGAASPQWRAVPLPARDRAVPRQEQDPRSNSMDQ